MQELVKKLCLQGEEVVEGEEQDRRQPAEEKGGKIIGRCEEDRDGGRDGGKRGEEGGNEGGGGVMKGRGRGA